MSRDYATNWDLIGRLAGMRGSEKDWESFDQVYRGLIRAIASQAGLSAEEVKDVEQETLATIWKKMSGRAPDFRAEAEYGSFRGWLRRVVRYRVQDQLRKRMPLGAQGGRGHSNQTARTATVERVADPQEPEWEDVFEREFQQQLFKQAVENLRSKLNPLHYQIFDYYVLRELPVEKVARSLEVSESLVYTTKNRVMKLLAKDVKRMEKQITRTLRPAQPPLARG